MLRAPDRTDRALLSLLQKNARLSNKELATEIGLAPSSCSERVRRLQEEGYFRGFRGQVDPKRLGIGLQAMVAVRLRRHSLQLVEGFRSHVLALNEVVRLYHIGGTNDFLIHVAVRDAEHLRELALTAFTARREVAHIETAIIFQEEETRELPNYLGTE